MGIDRFYDKSFIVQRIKTSSGYKKTMWSTGTVDAHIQNISEEDAGVGYGGYEATHKAWIDISDPLVQEGDRLHLSSTDVYYEVVEVHEKDFGLAVQHKELILKEIKE